MRISSAWTGRVNVCGCTGREVDGRRGDGGPSWRGWLYCVELLKSWKDEIRRYTYAPPHFVTSPCNLIATDEHAHAVT